MTIKKKRRQPQKQVEQTKIAVRREEVKGWKERKSEIRRESAAGKERRTESGCCREADKRNGKQ